jgi:hypothetical protein
MFSDRQPDPGVPMYPEIHLNYFALAAALLAKALLGHYWYRNFFAKAWDAERGVSSEAALPKPVHRRALILRWLGLALTVYVLAVGVQIIRPSSWNAGVDGPDLVYGFLTALFVWVGFYVPQLLARVAWEGASLRFAGVHAFYHFAALQIASQILAHWR